MYNLEPLGLSFLNCLILLNGDKDNLFASENGEVIAEFLKVAVSDAYATDILGLVILNMESFLVLVNIELLNPASLVYTTD